MCGVEHPNSAQWECLHHVRSAKMVRHPRGSYIVISIAVFGMTTPENKVTHWCGAVIHKQESRQKVPKSVFRALLGKMQFTLHATRRTPHGASRRVQAMSAWLVKARRAPSRHSRDARVYGHTTTAMHKLVTPPLILNLSSLFPCRACGAKKVIVTQTVGKPLLFLKYVCVFFCRPRPCHAWNFIDRVKRSVRSFSPKNKQAFFVGGMG